MLRASLIALFLLLSGCGGGYAPVYDQSLGTKSAAKPLARGEYRVQSGDTLFGIAFRLGVDPRELQRVNKIRDKNRIYVGQVLKTNFESTPVDKPEPKMRQEKRAPLKSEASKPGSTPAEISVAKSASKLIWAWPHNGTVLASFSSAEGGNKGLDIAGAIGEPVRAAADGTVAYAGSGLLGYGNLVIISHDQDHLSAYAHNSRILVREDQKVKRGEPIAELGSTGASRPMLHFEVRRDGRPVDPLRYLPKR